MAKFEEIRVQVSISYSIDPEKYNDDNLLEKVKDTRNFKATENQQWGCGCQQGGFLIFVGDTMPTSQDKQEMIKAVNVALSEIRKAAHKQQILMK